MAGIIHGAHAMMYGASKYGPFNWRDNAVIASIYIDATLRHLAAWFDSKEEVAEDSHVHHLGHVLANMAILLDAMETGNLIDDRPHSGKATEVLTRLNAKVAQLRKAPESVPDATGDSTDELVRQVAYGGGIVGTAQNASPRHGQQSGHPEVPDRERKMVCPKGPAAQGEDSDPDWNTSISYRQPYGPRVSSNWSR